MKEEAPRIATLLISRASAQDVLYSLMGNQDQRACTFREGSRDLIASEANDDIWSSATTNYSLFPRTR